MLKHVKAPHFALKDVIEHIQLHCLAVPVHRKQGGFVADTWYF